MQAVPIDVPADDKRDRLKGITDEKTHLFFGLNEQKYIAGSKIDGIVVIVVQCDQLSAKSLLVKWHGNPKCLFRNLISGSEQCLLETNILGNNYAVENKTIFFASTSIWSSDSQSTYWTPLIHCRIRENFAKRYPYFSRILDITRQHSI